MKQQNIRNSVLGCIFAAAVVLAGCGGVKVIRCAGAARLLLWSKPCPRAQRSEL